MNDKIKILLIIPAYNEEKNILLTCKSIDKYNKKSKNSVDYIVINDGSTDHTLEILKKNKIPHINLIDNLGIGGAVQTGYKYALYNDYDIAIQFDGDGQHDANYIDKIVDPIIKSQADLVIGSRFIKENESKFKPDFKHMLGINIISKVIKFKTGKVIYDTTSGFRAANKKIIKKFAKNYPQEYPVLGMGLYITHFMVPPTPGPLAVVSTFQENGLTIDLGIYILCGIAISVPLFIFSVPLLWPQIPQPDRSL